MSRAPRQTRSPFVRMLSPLRDFLALEAAGAVLIAVSAVAALIWANSPWSGSYEHFWSSRAAVSVAGHHLDLDLRAWINDGLMTVFFLVVGLEIKREMSDGHLSSRRAAVLPALAALGGMAVPALVYLAIAGSTDAHGWAIPVATDIALALGVLAIAGNRLPASLRAFLLGLAIVDDIGAIVIIAAFYSTGIGWLWLLVVAVSIGVVVVLRRSGVHSMVPYVAFGAVLWLAMHEAGIHPTLAGVALGLLAPSTPRLDVELIDADELTDLSDLEAAMTTSDLARGSVSVVEWLQHVLHPWTSYVIVPVFALANTGIEISATGLREAAMSPITWGIVAGLVLGKPLGIMLAVWLCVRNDVADPPAEASSSQILGVGAAGGIGFTVALFITDLALDDPADRNHAKLAILVASVLAATLSGVILARGTRRPKPLQT